MLCLIIAGSLFMGDTTGSNMHNLNQAIFVNKDITVISILSPSNHGRKVVLSDEYANMTLADTLNECYVQASRTAKGFN